MISTQKRFAFVTFALLGSLFLLGCSQSPPHIVVEPASQELGEVPQKLIELSYTVKNEGESDLQILKISTSCDCTKAFLEQDKISTGQSAVLTVTLDPTEDNLYGDVTRVIYLRSNDPENPEVSVEFHAIIVKPGEN